LGGVLMMIGGVPEPGSPILEAVGAGLASLGIGITFGIGLWEVATPEPGTTPAPKETISDTDVYGSAPPGVDAGTVIDLGDIDVTDLGDLPEDPPPPDPGGTPEGPGP
jgi:hypothetical protein